MIYIVYNFYRQLKVFDLKEVKGKCTLIDICNDSTTYIAVMPNNEEKNLQYNTISVNFTLINCICILYVHSYITLVQNIAS